MGLTPVGKKQELVERLLSLQPIPQLQDTTDSAADTCAGGGGQAGGQVGGVGFLVPADPLAPLEAELREVLTSEPLLQRGAGPRGADRAIVGGAGGASGGEEGGGVEEDEDGEDGAEEEGSPRVSAWLQNDLLTSREEEAGEEDREAMMDELNADLEQLDEEVPCAVSTRCHGVY